MSFALQPGGRLLDARGVIAAAAAYGAALVSLTWARPLWLDEILQLLITREARSAARLAMIHQTPGAVPLGYEVQRLLMNALGDSLFTARMPSEICAVLALAAMLLAARQLGTRGLVFVAAVWAVLPLPLRYAVEARPYAQSLLFSILSTILLFRLLKEPRTHWAVLYGGAVVAGLYTQPYSVFLQAGLWAPLLFRHQIAGVRRSLMLGSAALSGAVVLFTPWVLGSVRAWSAYSAGVQQVPSLTAKLPFLMLRELSGGGYICTLSLLAFAAAGCVSQRVDPVVKRQLLAGAAGCLLLPLAGDLAFHYFFAIRQAIFALVPLCLLAGEGWAECGDRWRAYCRLAVLVPLVMSSVVADVRHFRDRSEDWGRAARFLEIDSRSGCVAYPPPDAPGLFEFFEPDLGRRACGPALSENTILVPVTPYSLPGETRRLSEGLRLRGYREETTHRAGAFQVRRYRKARPEAPAGAP